MNTLVTPEEWRKLSTFSRIQLDDVENQLKESTDAMIKATVKIENLQTRLATLARLWSEFPAGTREFVGNYGHERAALLAAFEAALKGETE